MNNDAEVRDYSSFRLLNVHDAPRSQRELAHTLPIDGVVHERAAPLGMHEAGVAQDF